MAALGRFVLRPRPLVGRAAMRSERIARRLGWPRVVPGLFSFAVLAAVGAADGGVFPRTWRLGASAIFAAAAAALLARRRIAVTRLEAAAVAVLAGFTIWIALSTFWGGNASEAERALLYVGAVLVPLVLTERRSIPHLLAGALAGITLVAAYGLSIYVFTSPPLDQFQGALLHQPLGYANALGIFVVIGLLIAVGLGATVRRRVVRGTVLAPCLVLVPALVLTSSRGAWVALVVGLVALALLRAEDLRPRVVVLVATAVIGVAAVAAMHDGADFLTESRLPYWEVAWSDFREHPLLGSGAGTFGDYWLSVGAGPGFTRTAHSLYLHSLAELGPVGMLLSAAAVAVPLVALRRRRDSLVATAAAPYVAFVVHAGIDWDWEMPAVTLAGLFCGSAVLVATRPLGVRGLTPRARLALAAGSLLLAAFALVSARTQGSVPFA